MLNVPAFGELDTTGLGFRVATSSLLAYRSRQDSERDQ